MKQAMTDWLCVCDRRRCCMQDIAGRGRMEREWEEERAWRKVEVREGTVCYPPSTTSSQKSGSTRGDFVTQTRTLDSCGFGPARDPPPEFCVPHKHTLRPRPPPMPPCQLLLTSPPLSISPPYIRPLSSSTIWYGSTHCAAHHFDTFRR